MVNLPCPKFPFNISKGYFCGQYCHPCLFCSYISSLPEESITYLSQREDQGLLGLGRIILGYSLMRSLTLTPVGLGLPHLCDRWAVFHPYVLSSFNLTSSTPFFNRSYEYWFLYWQPSKMLLQGAFLFCHITDNLPVTCRFGLSFKSSFHMKYWYIKCHHWLTSDLSLFRGLLEQGTNTFVLCLALLVTVQKSFYRNKPFQPSPPSFFSQKAFFKEMQILFCLYAPGPSPMASTWLNNVRFNLFLKKKTKSYTQIQENENKQMHLSLFFY